MWKLPSTHFCLNKKQRSKTEKLGGNTPRVSRNFPDALITSEHGIHQKTTNYPTTPKVYPKVRNKYNKYTHKKYTSVWRYLHGIFTSCTGGRTGTPTSVTFPFFS